MISKLISSSAIFAALVVPANAGLDCANSVCTDTRATTYSAQQTFSLAPIFTTLTGYLKGNGASALTAISTIPVTDGGTGATTFTAGYVKSPGGTGALTTSSTIPSADFADGNTGTGAIAHATSPTFTSAQSDIFFSTATSGPAYVLQPDTSIASLGAGASIMYFDVSAGGATHGEYRFRSSNTYQTLMTLTSTAATFGGNVNVSGTLGLTAATWANNQTCTAGQITADASYIYVCTATNTVKRVALTAF